MKLHELTFRVEVQPTDTEPSGTVDQIAAQLFQEIKDRPLGTFRVHSLTMSQPVGGGAIFYIQAIGDEVVP